MEPLTEFQANPAGAAIRKHTGTRSGNSWRASNPDDRRTLQSFLLRRLVQGTGANPAFIVTMSLNCI